MLIESIGYTAMLVDFVARAAHQPIADITETIGETGIFRLAHNAPMNRHLPITQIAREVMSDYGISCITPDFSIMPNQEFSEIIMIKVQAETSQKNRYACVLYDLLCHADS